MAPPPRPTPLDTTTPSRYNDCCADYCTCGATDCSAGQGTKNGCMYTQCTTTPCGCVAAKPVSQCVASLSSGSGSGSASGPPPTCIESPFGWADSTGDSCKDYCENSPPYCDPSGLNPDPTSGKTASQACCHCGGGCPPASTYGVPGHDWTKCKPCNPSAVTPYGFTDDFGTFNTYHWKAMNTYNGLPTGYAFGTGNMVCGWAGGGGLPPTTCG